MDRERLIYADSHVAISVEAVRKACRTLGRHSTDGIAQQTAIDDELKGGKQLSFDDWDMEAFRDPGYSEPVSAWPRWTTTASTQRSSIPVSTFPKLGLVKATGAHQPRLDRPVRAARVGRPEGPRGHLQVPIIEHRLRRDGGEPAGRDGGALRPPPELSERVRSPRLPRAVSDPLWGALPNRNRHMPSPRQHRTPSRLPTRPNPRKWGSARRSPPSVLKKCSPGGSSPAPSSGSLSEDRLRRTDPLLGARIPLEAGPQGRRSLRLPRPEDQPERILQPQHGRHVHGRRGRSAAAPRCRHGGHPLVNRFPSPATTWPNGEV